MTTTGAMAWVADLYDSYVTTAVDIPFWVEEARAADGPVLELMTGTGRISVPLAKAGVDLTCVELSGYMLAKLRDKLTEIGLSAETYEQDVSELALPRRSYALALLPFQSFAELPSPEAQRATLAAVAAHLRPGARFICTLHNPPVRGRQIDGQLRLLGTVPLLGREGTLMLWSVQQRRPDSPEVQAAQIYEIYDADGRMVEKRFLDVRFRLVEREEFRSMAEEAGFRVLDLYGDYERTPFRDETSPYMIWVLEC